MVLQSKIEIFIHREPFDIFLVLQGNSKEFVENKAKRILQTNCLDLHIQMPLNENNIEAILKKTFKDNARWVSSSKRLQGFSTRASKPKKTKKRKPTKLHILEVWIEDVDEHTFVI